GPTTRTWSASSHAPRTSRARVRCRCGCWSGAEVTDLLAAMNTGHEGGCGTIHANSAGDVPARIEALAMAAGLPQAAVHSQLASAVEAVVQLARGPDGSRRVSEVAVLVRGADGRVEGVPAVTFAPDGS